MKFLFYLTLSLAIIGAGGYFTLTLVGEDPLEFAKQRLDEVVNDVRRPTSPPVVRPVNRISTTLRRSPAQPTAVSTPSAVPAQPSPIPAATVAPVTPQPSPSDTAVPQANPEPLWVTGSQHLGLRVRSSPAIHADNILGNMAEGTQLSGMSGLQDSDGFHLASGVAVRLVSG